MPVQRRGLSQRRRPSPGSYYVPDHNMWVKRRVSQVSSIRVVVVRCLPAFTVYVQRVVTLARYGLLYQIGARRPQLVLLPALSSWDPSCGSAAEPEDLDTEHWIGAKQESESLHRYPGTEHSLGNGYDIFFLPAGPRSSAPEYVLKNDLLQALFDVPWNGNLLVVKRGTRKWGSAISITRPEISLIGTVVEE